MRVGVEGARAAGAGNHASIDRDEVGTGHGAVQDMEQRMIPCEVGVRRGRLELSLSRRPGASLSE
jgi:hypothetical protein